jgi:hypothetical protein
MAFQSYAILVVIYMPNRSSMPLKKGLFGDWEKVGRYLNEKATTFDKFGIEPMLECAELYYEALTNGIRNQEFHFAPLSEAYRSRKASRGYGSLILIATGSYIEGMKISDVEERGDLKSVFVGADPNATHEPSGLPMSYLGAIHEYGTRDGRIPARPHYRPAWLKVRSQCRNIWLRHFREYARMK